jgi:hypothetical protein
MAATALGDLARRLEGWSGFLSRGWFALWTANPLVSLDLR